MKKKPAYAELEQRIKTLEKKISKHSQIKTSLKKNTSQYNLLAENINDAIWTVDKDLNFTYVSPSIIKFSGYTAEEMMKMSFLEQTNSVSSTVIAKYANEKELKKAMQSFCAEKDEETTPFIMEVEYFRKDGSKGWAEQNMTFLTDTKGIFSGIVGISRDVSERKKSQKTLNEMNKKLKNANNQLLESMETAQKLALQAEAANQYKGTFLANMSHELRTPLHGILSFAGFGIKKHASADPEKLLDYFKKIEISGQALLRQVNDLLDLAKLEAGKMTFTFELAELKKEVAVVVDELSSYLAERNISVNFSEPDFYSTILFDKEKIRQVMRNLVSNATKFSPPGGMITIEVKKECDSFIVMVQDNGPGLPENELKNIFDKFIQSTAITSSEGGTGLGLTICQEIINAHGGRIWAENIPEGGALLSFELPARRKETVKTESVEIGCSDKSSL